MSFALRETSFVLLSLLLFVEILSIKDCCPKPLDPDAFRNVVSIYLCDTLAAFFLRVISIMRFSLAVYVFVLIETSHCKSVDIIKLSVYHSRTCQVFNFTYSENTLCRGQILLVTWEISKESSLTFKQNTYPLLDYFLFVSSPAMAKHSHHHAKIAVA